MELYLGVSNKSGFGCLYLADSADVVEQSCGSDYAVSEDSFAVRVIEGEGVARELYVSKSYLTPAQNLLAAAREVALDELRSALRKGFKEDEVPEVTLRKAVVVTCLDNELSSFVVTGISLLENSEVSIRGHWAASLDDNDLELTVEDVASDSICVLTAAVRSWLGEL